MKAVILAAGKGERLRPITETIPKPLIPVNGKPLLEINIELLKKNGFSEININTSHLAEEIKKTIGDGKKFGLKINYSKEDKLLGTSGALNNFKKNLTGDFLVFYGDNLTDINLREMMAFHKKKKGLATIFLHKETLSTSDTTPGSVIINEDGSLYKIIENPNEAEKLEIKMNSDKSYNNSGIYILNEKIFDYIPKEGFSDFSKDIFPKALDKGEKIYSFLTKCFYRELGVMERYKKTLIEIKEGKIQGF